MGYYHQQGSPEHGIATKAFPVIAANMSVWYCRNENHRKRYITTVRWGCQSFRSPRIITRWGRPRLGRHRLALFYSGITAGEGFGVDDRRSRLCRTLASGVAEHHHNRLGLRRSIAFGSAVPSSTRSPGGGHLNLMGPPEHSTALFVRSHVFSVRGEQTCGRLLLL